MFVFLNGAFVAESEAKVSIMDRGFLYGDGLFETLRVYRGAPFRWNAHLRRLHHGLGELGVTAPLKDAELRDAADELIARNNAAESILRIQITRGPGRRGYASAGAVQPTIVMTTHPAPPVSPSPPLWTLIASQFRVQSGNRLNCTKSSNKLINVLAKDEAAQKGADESLLLNERDEVVESTSANVFWIKGDAVCTPPLSSGALPGVTRDVVMEICESLQISLREQDGKLAAFHAADGVFLTLSSWEVVEASSIDGASLNRSQLPGRLFAAYRDVVDRETPA